MLPRKGVSVLPLEWDGKVVRMLCSQGCDASYDFVSTTSPKAKQYREWRKHHVRLHHSRMRLLMRWKPVCGVTKRRVQRVFEDVEKEPFVDDSLNINNIPHYKTCRPHSDFAVD